MGIMVMRAVVGVALLQAGAILFGTKAVERPLAVTLLILGGFSIVNLLADFIFLKLRKKDEKDAAGAPSAPPAPPPAPAAQPAIQQPGALPGFLESAAFYVTTPAFVLALLSLFGDRRGGPTMTLKVGSAALAATLLTGLALHGYVSATTEATPRAKAFVHVVFNVALWLFALGVVSIAISIVYQ